MKGSLLILRVRCLLIPVRDLHLLPAGLQTPGQPSCKAGPMQLQMTVARHCTLKCRRLTSQIPVLAGPVAFAKIIVARTHSA
jgi:hypothetical protein